MVLEPCVIKKRSARNGSILLINDFPPDLMEKCKTFSREKVGTRAVLKTLEKLFVINSEFCELKARFSVLNSDLDLAKKIISDDVSLSNRKIEFLNLKQDRFVLEVN